MDIQKKSSLTPHHTRRRKHALAFIASVAIVAILAWVLGIVLAEINVQPNDSKFSVIEPSSPASVVVNNLSEQLRPRQLNQQSDEGRVLSAESSAEKPSITVVPGESIQQRYVLRDGEVQPVFIFHTQHPKFIGLTNLQNITAALDIFGPSHVIAKAPVDSNGNWVWEPTVPIMPGTYIFSVKAIKSQSNTVLAKDSLVFEIVLSKGEEVVVVELKNTPQLGNGGTLFDVRTAIPAESKVIQAGAEVSAGIKFINFGPAGKPVDVEVQYTITNETKEKISQTSETMAIAKELEFSKSFYTSSSLPSGVYTLTVAVPSQDLIATASDTFEIRSQAVSSVAATQKKSPFSGNSLIFGLLGALLLLSVIVAYIEYNKILQLSRVIRQLSGKSTSK